MGVGAMKAIETFHRVWAMPSANTFDIAPIGGLVRKYLRDSVVSIDPFARDKLWATYTNDLNPDTASEYHMHAIEFLNMLIGKGVQADLVLFDPPYSPHQIKEVYDGIGIDMGRKGGQLSSGWTQERNAIHNLLSVGGVAISLGWNSMGMGMRHGYEFTEGLLVCSGACHNDTIVTVERKVAHQLDMFKELQ